MNAIPANIEAQAPVKGPWTPERIERLEALWAEDLSASAIAARLSHDAGQKITRNAVIGKIHRLGLVRAVQPNRRPATRRPATPGVSVISMPDGAQVPQRRPQNGIAARNARMRQAQPSPVIAPPKVGAFEALPGVTPVRLGDARPTHCRWPVDGGGAGLDMLYCGAEVPIEATYCLAHAARSAGRAVTEGTQCA